jgi:hypothetical protein
VTRRYTPRPTRPQERARKLAKAKALAESGVLFDAAIDRALTEAMAIIDAPRHRRCQQCDWPLVPRPGLFPRRFCSIACHKAWVHRKREASRQAHYRQAREAARWDPALKLG